MLGKACVLQPHLVAIHLKVIYVQSKKVQERSVDPSSQQPSHRAIAEQLHIHFSHIDTAPRQKHTKAVKVLRILLH